ncbi:pantoate--beta-alanine ligase, partial [uncultured Spongiibacter sp.]|uniref:pantoate--beta-alanine ligase n=1 Tax=uncultured Spongiibacter sp. TaxID=870896 RepID=UPI00338EEF58
MGFALADVSQIAQQLGIVVGVFRAGTGIAGRHYFLALIGAHPPVQTLRDLPALRAAVDALRSDGRPIALVPTMGALHDGHMALVEEARRHGRHVVVSIFV